MSASIHRRLFHLCNYLILSGNPGKRLMYDSMRTDLYWLYIASDLYATVLDCQPCAQKRTNEKRERQLRCFPWSLVEIGWYGHIEDPTKTKQGN